VERKRGPQWYAKYRLPDGRQVQRHLGPAWTFDAAAGDRSLDRAVLVDVDGRADVQGRGTFDAHEHAGDHPSTVAQPIRHGGRRAE
jgi:hypothetical protein